MDGTRSSLTPRGPYLGTPRLLARLATAAPTGVSAPSGRWGDCGWILGRVTGSLPNQILAEARDLAAVHRIAPHALTSSQAWDVEQVTGVSVRGVIGNERFIPDGEDLDVPLDDPRMVVNVASLSVAGAPTGSSTSPAACGRSDRPSDSNGSVPMGPTRRGTSGTGPRASNEAWSSLVRPLRVRGSGVRRRC